MGEIAQTHWDDCYRAVAQSNINERKEIEAENEQLKARLAVCEKALRNLLNSLSSSDDEGLMEHADAVRDARAAIVADGQWREG